tara:strand:- start:70 stop:489 length:420 start_codon:yes stop_codon:yes gene_type:complete
MVQVNRNGGSATKPKVSITENYAKNFSASITNAYVNELDIDSRGDVTGNVIIHNGGVGDLDYRVLGTCEHIDDVIPPVVSDGINRDNGWVVLVTGSIATATVPKEYDIANNFYTKIVVQVKFTNATTITRTWYRGTRSE